MTLKGQFDSPQTYKKIQLIEQIFALGQIRNPKRNAGCLEHQMGIRKEGKRIFNFSIVLSESKHKETNLSSSLKISQTNDARKPNARHSLQPGRGRGRGGQLKDAQPSPDQRPQLVSLFFQTTPRISLRRTQRSKWKIHYKQINK